MQAATLRFAVVPQANRIFDRHNTYRSRDLLPPQKWGETRTTTPSGKARPPTAAHSICANIGGQGQLLELILLTESVTQAPLQVSNVVMSRSQERETSSVVEAPIPPLPPAQ